MEMPLHPAVTSEIARGREYLERLRELRRVMAGMTVTVPCPDGDNTITVGGDGMVVDASFVEDVFDRYPGDKLSELLLAMAEEGFAQVAARIDAEVSAVTDASEPR